MYVVLCFVLLLSWLKLSCSFPREWFQGRAVTEIWFDEDFGQNSWKTGPGGPFSPEISGPSLKKNGSTT